MESAEQLSFVADSLDWEKMDGESALEKKLNAFLAYTLVSKSDVPAGQCLEVAQAIAQEAINVDKVFGIVWQAFKPGFEPGDCDDSKQLRLISEWACAIKVIAKSDPNFAS